MKSKIASAASRRFLKRTDGRVQTQAIDDAAVSGIVNPGTTTIAYAYTAAGRMTERSESGAAANSTPTTRTYDSNGMELSDATPGATLSAMEYSAENELLGLTAPHAPLTSGTTYTYTVRGEITSWPHQTGAQFISPEYANGTQISDVTEYGQTGLWDTRMAVLIASATVSLVAYDAAGRLTFENNGSTGTTRTYDAENHTLISDSEWQGSGGNEFHFNDSLQWGPNGHPILVGGTSSGNPSEFDTLHWDGDTLLFTTNSSGQLDDIKIGAEGDITPLDPSYKGLTFYDRDPSGGTMGCHNATGATFVGVADVYARPFTGKVLSGTLAISPCSTSTLYAKVTGSPTMPSSIIWWGTPATFASTTKPVGQGGVLGMPRVDGYADGTDIVQGVRTYDANAGIWTTPDAYSGDVDDPASQKSYVWNGNNPEMYSDPSGFLTQAQQQEIQDYLESTHSAIGWPWLTYCTQYVLDVYQRALGINLNTLMLIDYENHPN